jgi:hypothetical protein
MPSSCRVIAFPQKIDGATVSAFLSEALESGSKDEILAPYAR